MSEIKWDPEVAKVNAKRGCWYMVSGAFADRKMIKLSNWTL